MVATIAGTPPWKAVRLGLALAACLIGSSGRKKFMIFGLYYVLVAFYRTKMEQDIHVIPPNSEEEKGWAWQLQRARCGSCRASLLFTGYGMEVLEIQIEGRVGPPEFGGMPSGQFLWRTIAWTSSACSWEGDPAEGSVELIGRPDTSSSGDPMCV